ncbi:DUF3151 domain-containing protein [Raineyella sp.]|uniref:DUF3151 domain-containing protein n=1 Tax=Raineyella sp. TaxID=1911550 RepID=UPI003A5231A7
MSETHHNLLADEAPVTRLPEDPAVAELADHGRERFLDIVCAHPQSSLCWALLAEGSLNMGSRDGDVAAYAYARTGYHRGLDLLRRNGWKGAGAVPWEHEPNRGFLKALWALAVAAHRIGEDDEYERCAQFLRDSSQTGYDVLTTARPLARGTGNEGVGDGTDEQMDEVVEEAGGRQTGSPMSGPDRDEREAWAAGEDEPSDHVLDSPYAG